MINKKIHCSFIFLAFYALCNTGAQAFVKTNAPYIGVIGGYGSTTWDGLVPSARNMNDIIAISTPIKVNEGGAVWGFLAGYEFSPNFAVEANYINYPDAEISFQPMTAFPARHNDIYEFSSSTELFNLIGKIMLTIPNTKIRAFSGAGIANVHRKDLALDDWRVSPSFGVGFTYPLGEHFMASLVGDYTAGFGESQLSPADSYFPFLYSVTARLAYRF